jgi:hypothetical protein
MKTSIKTFLTTVLILSLFGVFAQTKPTQTSSKTKQSLIPTSSPLNKLSSLGGNKEKNDKNKGNVPESSFRKGSKYLGGNVNFGSSTSTSVTLFAEYGVTDYLSVGGSTSIATSSLYRTFYFGGDATLHLCNLLHLGSIDPFVGVSGGYNSFKDKNATEERDRSKDPNTGLRVIGNAGVNYFISPKMIAFVNVSLGIVNASPIQYGGGIKFGL